MSAGEVAGLIAALAFVLLVGILAIPLLKLATLLTETQRLVADVDRQTVPLLSEVTASVGQVNAELVKVEAITANVQSISGNVSALTALFAATMGSPIIKVAAFTYGVRSAIGQKQRGEVEKRVAAQGKADRAERKAQRGSITMTGPEGTSTGSVPS